MKTKRKPRTEQVNIRLDKDECEQLHAHAARAGTTASEYVRRLLRRELQGKAQIAHLKANGPPAIREFLKAFP